MLREELGGKNYNFEDKAADHIHIAGVAAVHIHIAGVVAVHIHTAGVAADSLLDFPSISS
jgi:hypothetical protein